MARTRRQERLRKRAQRRRLCDQGLTVRGTVRRRPPYRGTLDWYLWQLRQVGYLPTVSTEGAEPRHPWQA